jgi:DNA polymerase-3 subunit epsilon
LYFVITNINEEQDKKKRRAQVEAKANRSRWGSNEDRKYREEPKKCNEQYPPTRKHAKPEIDKFLNVKRKTRLIIFDLETNGLSNNHSVLSCSAIKYDIDPNICELSELDRFDRYYYPVEEFDQAATSVNGLTKEVITEKRGNAIYPEHFKMDSDFEVFCSDTKRFAAHNISFDSRFIPFMAKHKKFCTMMTNTDIVAVYYMKSKRDWKWPKLSETAAYYNISFNESDLHGSMADTEITSKIFMEMLKRAKNSSTLT